MNSQLKQNRGRAPRRRAAGIHAPERVPDRLPTRRLKDSTTLAAELPNRAPGCKKISRDRRCRSARSGRALSAPHG